MKHFTAACVTSGCAAGFKYRKVLSVDIVQCECACRWSRLTGDPPLTERTRLNVREFTLNPGVKVSGSVNANANNLIIISLSLSLF